MSHEALVGIGQSLKNILEAHKSSLTGQAHKHLYEILTILSLITGGLTTNFSMLGDIIIVKPNPYIAFTSKKVIKQTLNKTVPEGSQTVSIYSRKAYSI